MRGTVFDEFVRQETRFVGVLLNLTQDLGELIRRTWSEFETLPVEVVPAACVRERQANERKNPAASAAGFWFALTLERQRDT